MTGAAHPFDKILQHFDLNQRLVMEALLVANDLDRDHFARSVITALQDLAERALAQHVNDLVTISNVISWYDEVVASFIVVAVVVCWDVL